MVRGHVGQDRLLVQVVADERRHERIERLVVDDAVADGIGHGHGARADGGHQAGHTEQGVVLEEDRVDRLVVDASVDDVDLLEAARGAHQDPPVLDHEIASLDQLDAHLAGEEDMLEVGRVEDPGCQHDDHRLAGRRRRQLPEGAQQRRAVMVDGRTR